MTKPLKKRTHKKKLGRYPQLMVIFSITLALFVIGLFGMLLLHAAKLSDKVKENLEMQVYLDRGLTDYSASQPGEPDAHRLQQVLRTRFTVNQAIGVLMATHGITADLARAGFHQRLGRTAYASAEQVARDIINQHTPGTEQTDTGPR